MRLKVKETCEQEQLSTLTLQHTKDMCTNTQNLSPNTSSSHTKRDHTSSTFPKHLDAGNS